MQESKKTADKTGLDDDLVQNKGIVPPEALCRAG